MDNKEKTYRIKPLVFTKSGSDLYCDMGYRIDARGNWTYTVNSIIIEEDREMGESAAEAACNAHHAKWVEQYLEEVK